MSDREEQQKEELEANPAKEQLQEEPKVEEPQEVLQENPQEEVLEEPREDAQEEPKEEAQEIKDETPYLYQWDYDIQCQHDHDRLIRQRKRSLRTFAFGMAAVMLVCLGLIVGAVLLNRSNTSTGVQPNTPTNTEAVAALVSQQTVLISVEIDGNVSYGTGFFIHENGYIATNFHVIEGASQIQVTLYSGISKKATVVGSSPSDDLAVIKISGTGYPTARIGNSDAVVAGATAIVVGHPLGAQYPWTVTQGIISFTHRQALFSTDYEIIEMTLMQFDAPVNGGNSGGPVCNDRGEVIGITTRKHASLEGVGMALPINGAIEILNAIMMTGSADGVVSQISKTRPLLGITGATVKVGDPYYDGEIQHTAGHDGVLILGISDTGAAINLVELGDIIISLNGLPIASMEDLTAALYGCKSGQTITIELWRNGAAIEQTVTFPSPK